MDPRGVVCRSSCARVLFNRVFAVCDTVGTSLIDTPVEEWSLFLSGARVEEYCCMSGPVVAAQSGNLGSSVPVI